VKLASGHITNDADAESLLEEVELFVDRVLSSEVKPVDVADDYPWFGGQKAVEFKDANGGVHFMGLRKSFENITQKAALERAANTDEALH
jgi:hypothetical protein